MSKGNFIDKSSGMKIKFMSWVCPVLILLTSCESKSSQRENEEQLNKSAIYDPPSITLREGVVYDFAEGKLMGKGQRFHSHYSYMRALVIGD